MALTGANIAQNSLGLTGAGVKVGIIDTGIDIDHPAFGGSGTPGSTSFPTERVAYGYDFVGDAYNSSGGQRPPSVPVPDTNPDDCNGHGTHVAGIVGANGGGITGVAPGVTFGAYRVFGCTGSTSSDVIVAALERAYADGMHVINQSLGAARQWPQYPTAQASSRLVNKGVVMVASIGNNGPGGSSPDALFAAGAPGVGDEGDRRGVVRQRRSPPSAVGTATPYGYNQATRLACRPNSGTYRWRRPARPTSAARWLHAPSSRASHRQRRADPSWHLLVLHQGRRTRRTPARRPWCFTTTRRALLNPTVAGDTGHHDPGGGITAAQACCCSTPHRGRPDHAHLDDQTRSATRLAPAA